MGVWSVWGSREARTGEQSLGLHSASVQHETAKSGWWAHHLWPLRWPIWDRFLSVIYYWISNHVKIMETYSWYIRQPRATPHQHPCKNATCSVSLLIRWTWWSQNRERLEEGECLSRPWALLTWCHCVVLFSYSVKPWSRLLPFLLAGH